ncbi:MAG TPA: lysylphosphatidylglycerol synthase transmembrane domain-containing protein [Verrucomicrobiae bacterium]|nr:lysylphosphatidylglycerol synthase transmembrane domain-containing protein [Verrucomicrobiae bacterium]
MKEQSTGRKVWRLSWRIAVCVFLLAWIFQLIFYNEGRIAWQGAGHNWNALTKLGRFQVAWLYGPSGLLGTLKLMDPQYLVGSIALMGLLLFVGVLRWQIILKVHGLGLPLSRNTEISIIAHFFNSFLLGSVGGDLLKAYYAARETHHKKTEAAVTVAVDRVIGLFSLLLVACLMLLLNRDLISVLNAKLKIVIWTILAMTAGCGGFILVSFWGGVSKGIPKARYWLRKLPKGELLERSIEAFREFGRDRTFFLRVLPVAMLGNGVCILHFLTLIWGFHLKVPILAIAAIVPVVTCISTLPITPSGLGVRENLYVWFLSVPGVDVPPGQALLISLVGYGTSLFWSAVGGFVYLTVRDKEHLQEIAAQSAEERAA